MAENKKGFIIYCDLIKTVKKLPPEKQGNLFMHILEYVNDLNPETNDLLIEIAFEPIKQQLKRDLKDWDSKRLKRAEAGKKGGLAKSSNAKQNIASSSNATKDVANVAVTDTVTVTVTDTVTDTVIDTVIKEKKKPKKVSGGGIEIIKPFLSENFNIQWNRWKEYKWKEMKFKYKSEIAEASALKKLDNLSKQNESIAIKIIEESISNGWAGFFELKNTNNGTSNTNHETPEQRQQKYLAGILGSDKQQNGNQKSDDIQDVDFINVP